MGAPFHKNSATDPPELKGSNFENAIPRAIQIGKAKGCRFAVEEDNGADLSVRNRQESGRL